MYKYAGIFMISAACASFGVISTVGMKHHIELLAALCAAENQSLHLRQILSFAP